MDLSSERGPELPAAAPSPRREGASRISRHTPSAWGRASAAAVVALALLSVLGWLIGWHWTASWGSSYKPMSAASALLFASFGALLHLNACFPRRKPVQALMAAATAAAFGYGFWILNFSSQSLPIIELVAERSALTFLKEHAGRMSPLTAVGWMVASVPLLFSAFPLRRRWSRLAADVPALVVFFVGLTCAIGYLYRMPFSYGGAGNPPSLPTSVLFMLLAASFLALTPARSVFLEFFVGRSIQSRLLRIFMPGMLFSLIAAGWIYTSLPLSVSRLNRAFTWALTLTAVLLTTGCLIAAMTRLAGRQLDAAQAQLRASEAMLRSSQRVAALGHYDLTVATGSWTSSEMLDELFGIPPDYPKDVAGWLRCVHPEQRAEMQGYFREHVLRDKNRFDKEYRIVRQSDGTQRWVHGFGDLEFGAGGEPVRMFGVIQDITERKLVEEDLRLNRERLEEAQTIAKIGNWEANLVSGDLYWSEVIFDIFGFDPVRFHPSVKAFYEAVHPEDRQEVLASEARSERTGLHDVVHRIVRPDGEVRFVRELAKRYTDAEGRPVMLRGTVQDITELKRTEETITRQNTLLLDVLNSLTHPFYVIDAATYQIVMANPATHVPGLEANITCHKLTHGLNRPCNTSNHPCPLAEVKRGRKAITVEHVHLDKDHRRRYEIHAYPIFGDNGEVSRIIEYTLDVTERHLAQERYRSIFENAVEGIFQSTPEGRFLSVNPAFARIYGYGSPQEVVETVKDIGRQLYVDPRQREELIALLWRQGTVRNFESQEYRKDGSVIWISTNVQVVRDRPEHALFFEGTCQDITERKALEAQLLQSQKMEAVGKLAGGIAHDFNNMLTSIIGNAEFLLYKRKKTDETSGRLSTIRKTAEGAAQLTRQLLMLSRRHALKPQALDLNHVIQGMQRMLERIVGEDVLIEFHPAAGLRLIKADPMSIEQLVLNLVVNARQAMPRGGRLLLATENVPGGRRPDGAANAPPVDDRVSLIVSDDGAGIPPEVIGRIFEPFFTTKSSGTGLGLSIVSGIVKQSAGTVDVTSQPGAGTTFRILLPALPPPARADRAEDTARELPLPSGGETILVVEDDATILELIRTVLSHLRYQVLASRSGEEALRLIREEGRTADLMLTDVVLPGINGGDLAKAIRRKIPGVKVLFMSGYPDERIALKEIAETSDRFITKPFETAALARKIRELLDSK